MTDRVLIAEAMKAACEAYAKAYCAYAGMMGNREGKIEPPQLPTALIRQLMARFGTTTKPQDLPTDCILHQCRECGTPVTYRQLFCRTCLPARPGASDEHS